MGASRGRSPLHKLYLERNLVNKRKLALGYKAQNQFVYSLRAAAPYGATALGLIYKMIDLKTIPCPMNAIPLLLVSALRADTVFV